MMRIKRRVAVLGSNSFSGADFIDLLLEVCGYNVIGISRSPEKNATVLPHRRQASACFAFYQLDLNADGPRIVALLDAFKPEYIVNFAAQSEVAPSWNHPEQWFETNVVALARLINELKGRGYLKRYVQISSPEVYGHCAGIATEEAALNPSTPYAASKAAADLLLATYVKHFGFPVVTIRATNVYGAHQQLWKIIPRSVVCMKLGKKIPLHGGGVAVKSFIHVRDVSRGELAAMEEGRVGEVYHLSPSPGNDGYAVRDIVQRLCKLMAQEFSSVVEIVGERLGQDAAYVIDSSKARSEFGWRPEVGIDRGLAEIVGWVDGNWSAIQHEPLEYIHKP